jgi:hypothetical protein
MIPIRIYFELMVTLGGMFFLPISKHFPVKLHENLLDAKMLKYPLSRQ